MAPVPWCSSWWRHAIAGQATDDIMARSVHCSLLISIVYMNDILQMGGSQILAEFRNRKKMWHHHSWILLNSFLNDSKPAFARTWATPQTQRGGDWKIGVAKLLALFGRFSSSGIDASTQPAFAKLPKASGETAEFPGKKLWENRWIIYVTDVPYVYLKDCQGTVFPPTKVEG